MKRLEIDEVRQVTGGEVTSTATVDLGGAAPYPYPYPYPGTGATGGGGLQVDQLLFTQVV